MKICCVVSPSRQVSLLILPVYRHAVSVIFTLFASCPCCNFHHFTIPHIEKTANNQQCNQIFTNALPMTQKGGQ
ncbi:hypothetical protein DAI22_11g128800 [Oryza sativa Japonica Group]|nr:hypothetical protein DAI22_11g128800 [Oryza sativa Japonica Group]